MPNLGSSPDSIIDELLLGTSEALHQEEADDELVKIFKEKPVTDKLMRHTQNGSHCRLSVAVANR